MFYKFDWKALLTDSKQKKSKICNNVFGLILLKANKRTLEQMLTLSNIR